MPSTYTSSLRLVLPATGELTNTWGNVFNAGATSLIDASIAGTASITMTAADYTLSNANGAADESRAMFLVLGGTPGGSYNVICPAVSKLYFVTNNTGFAQTVKTSAGTGISVPDGARMTLRCNGTDVVAALNYFGSLTLGTALGVASGGTGGTSFTANNVLLGNGTSGFQVVAPGASGNVLTSDGTTWQSSAPASSVTTISFGTTGLTPSTATGGAVTVAGTLAVANGGTGVTTSTGSGSVVLSTSPSLTTPNLGTPSAVTLTSATGLPLSTGVTGTLPVGNGGTGITSGTSGGVPYFSATNTITSSAALAANNFLIGGGAGAAPSSSSLLQIAAAVTTGNYVRSVGYADTVTALGNTSTAINLDVTSGGVFTATLTGNATITLRYPVATGSSSFTLILTNDGTAGRTVAWAGGAFRFPGGAASLSRTTTANAVDIWVFFTPDAGTTWYGNIAMKDVKA